MPSTTAQDRTSAPARRSLALLATSLGFTVVQLDVSVVNVAVQPIRADLGGSVAGAQWIVGAYTVVFAALILGAGSLGDRIGAKRVFVAGFAVFTVASVACGLAPSLGSLIGARAVQGIGAALLVPCSLSVLTHAFPDDRERARAVGLWAAGASVGLSGGPIVGGLLTAALGWRWIFFLNLPLGVLGIALTLRFADETSRAPHRRVDVPGQLLGVGALALLAGATIEDGRRGFGDALVLGGFGLALAALVAFVVVEARSTSPMLRLGLFRSRVFAAASAMGLVVNIAFYGLIFVLSLYFQTVLHYSPLRAGLAFVPMTAVVFAANTTSGRWADRYGTRRLLAVAAVLLGVGVAGLLVTGTTSSYGVFVGQLVLVGVGLGLIVPVMTSVLLGTVERERAGVASGTLNTARQTGSVIGVALFGSFAASGVVTGLHTSAWVSLVLAVGTLALAAVMPADREPGR